MMKFFLIAITITLPTIFFGQNSPCGIGYGPITDNDTSKVITVHVKLKERTSREVEKGFYKVFKIDDLYNFYLIFIEKNGNISTIYSSKNVINYPSIAKEFDNTNIQKLSIGQSYYFELTCKDTLANGMCLPIVPNVTYFGKYTGGDLKKVQKAKNLFGLLLVEPK